jgi:hypothetical protein
MPGKFMSPEAALATLYFQESYNPVCALSPLPRKFIFSGSNKLTEGGGRTSCPIHLYDSVRVVRHVPPHPDRLDRRPSTLPYLLQHHGVPSTVRRNCRLSCPQAPCVLFSIV